MLEPDEFGFPDDELWTVMVVPIPRGFWLPPFAVSGPRRRRELLRRLVEVGLRRDGDRLGRRVPVSDCRAVRTISDLLDVPCPRQRMIGRFVERWEISRWPDCPGGSGLPDPAGHRSRRSALSAHLKISAKAAD